MAKVAPFETYHERYERWFDEHREAYVSELLALRPFVPFEGEGLEIGVGTARFAAPLGVQVGLDPSPAMLTRAAARGLVTVEGTAEALPFGRSCFDHVLVVTTICFVDSPSRMIDEAHRVLRPRGKIVIAFIDREGLLGRHYLAHQSESIFYRDAVFYSAPEVDELLRQGSFVVRAWGQTLFRPLAEVKEIEPLRAGKGRGSFVVVEAERAEGHWPDEGAPRLVS